VNFLKDSFKKAKIFSPIRLTVFSNYYRFLSFSLYTAWQWFSLNRPPRLELFQPEDNQITSARVIVEGHDGDGCDGGGERSASVFTSDGFFNTELYFDIEGPTTITVKASDRRGKTSIVQKSIQVEY
jgi:hypothetical protein